jgi:phosphoribosylcarboxyaminoimidazole (NCAIR) mutase
MVGCASIVPVQCLMPAVVPGQMVGLGSAIAIALSAMYIVGMDSKEIEGQVSPYRA